MRILRFLGFKVLGFRHFVVPRAQIVKVQDLKIFRFLGF
jgi:hypothetical protein